jgi:NAD(P)H-nitrite reductase large subunit
MQRHIEKKGIKIVTGSAAKEITGAGSVEGIVLEDGSKYDCELVIIGKGVSPNIDIARDAGIKTNWGIVADEFLRTSEKHVFAAGDVAESYDITLAENSINAIWPVACEQGRVAGLNMAGGDEHYDGTMAMNSIEFFGMPVISIGITKPKKDIYPAPLERCGVYEEIVRKDERRNIYKKVVLKNNMIVGAVFLNAVDSIGIVGTLIKHKADISAIKDIILEDYFDYGRALNLIKDSAKGFKQKEFQETIMTL